MNLFAVKKRQPRFVAILLALGLLAAPLCAFAIPIYGEIGLGGIVTPVDSLDQVSSLGDAVGIRFDNPVYFGGMGDLANLAAPLTPIAMTDFLFDPFPGTGVMSLWGPIAGFSFDLTSVVVEEQLANSLRLSGQGIINGTGFDPTPGNWSLTAQGPGAFITFSSGTIAVPEPSTTFLLGIGLIGLLAVRRKHV